MGRGHLSVAWRGNVGGIWLGRATTAIDTRCRQLIHSLPERPSPPGGAPNQIPSTTSTTPAIPNSYPIIHDHLQSCLQRPPTRSGRQFATQSLTVHRAKEQGHRAARQQRMSFSGRSVHHSLIRPHSAPPVAANSKSSGRRSHSEDRAPIQEKSRSSGKSRSKTKNSQHADVIDRLDFTGVGPSA